MCDPRTTRLNWISDSSHRVRKTLCGRRLVRFEAGSGGLLLRPHHPRLCEREAHGAQIAVGSGRVLDDGKKVPFEVRLGDRVDAIVTGAKAMLKRAIRETLDS